MPPISRPIESSREARRNPDARHAFVQGVAVTGTFWLLALAIVYLQVQLFFMDGLVFWIGFVFGGTLLACLWWLVALALCLAGMPWFKGSLLIHTVALIPVLYMVLNFSPFRGNLE